MDEAGNALGDFGLSLIKLCKFEDEEGAALGQYTQQGAATKSLASTCKSAGQVSLCTVRPSLALNLSRVQSILHSIE